MLPYDRYRSTRTRGTSVGRVQAAHSYSFAEKFSETMTFQFYSAGAGEAGKAQQ